MKAANILMILVLALGLMVCRAQVGEVTAMETAFTYQGRLMDASVPADGLYDLQLKLYDSIGDVANQVGGDVNKPDVDVINSYFTVELDFASGAFAGDARWLEAGVRPAEMSGPNAYTVLSPRQPLTAAPYALQTLG